MIIKPMVRNNICLNAHPAGCAASVRRQIAYVQHHLSPAENIPQLALIIGCSNGYGLASRIAAAFGYRAVTVGVSLERPSSATRTATPGFYNNLGFERQAAKAGLLARTLNGDAFSDETKAETAAAVREVAAVAKIPPKIDLVVYSLASPIRIDPRTGVMYESVLKPIGRSYAGKSLNIMSGTFTQTQAEPATEAEIASTVKVMGGEDWELWVEALEREGLLSPQTRMAAFSYLGPEHSWPIYKNGTIGKAKEDLERACRNINQKYTGQGKMAGAWISINKAVVTRSSAVIPVISLYVSCLFKVMKEKGLHEGCIEQMVRLYRDRLYCAPDPAQVPVDGEGRIRLDDWEMRGDVQKAVAEIMDSVTEDHIFSETDAAGFKHDLFETCGFDVAGVDYTAEVSLDGNL